MQRRGSFTNFEFKETKSLEYKFKRKTKVIWFNPRTASREIWKIYEQTVDEDVIESKRKPMYIIKKKGEKRKVLENVLEEWVDLEALKKRKKYWDKLYHTVWNAIDPIIIEKRKEVLAGFTEGTTKGGDYYRHCLRAVSNKATKDLMEQGVSYPVEDLSLTGFSPAMMCVCDPNKWRTNWREKRELRNSYTSGKRKLPNIQQSLNAIGVTDANTNKCNDSRFRFLDKFFVPLPVPAKNDFLCSYKCGETPEETFESYKTQSNLLIPTGNYRRNLYIAFLEELPNRIETKIATYIRSYFYNIHVTLIEVPSIECLHVRHREHEGTGARQLHVDDLAGSLHDYIPSDAFVLVVITMEDLYSGSYWNFTFGKEYISESNHYDSNNNKNKNKNSDSKNIAVLSLARYDPAFWRNVDLFEERRKKKMYFEPRLRKNEEPRIEEDYLGQWRARYRVDCIKKKWEVPKSKRKPYNTIYSTGIATDSAGGMQSYTDNRSRSTMKYIDRKMTSLGLSWTARHRESEDWQVILKRACKIVSKEMDHLCGLGHCLHFSCRMNGSIHIRELDLSPMHLCPVCLHKHMFATGIHSTYRCTERFVELGDWFRMQGATSSKLFVTETKWVLARQKSIDFAAEKLIKNTVSK